MPTFLEAQTILMKMVNRPMTETDVLDGVKEAINDAILVIQRNHPYVYTEKFASFTYPIDTLSVDLGDVCEGPIRDIISVQQMSASGILQGKPLKVVKYSALQSMRNKYERSHNSSPAYNNNDPLVGYTIEDGFQSDLIVFQVGQYIGLYPRPATLSYLAIHCHIWLPALSADADTNFLLTYAYDVVKMIALKRMHIYMKTDSRYAITEQEVTDALAGLIAWDGQLSSTANGGMG